MNLKHLWAITKKELRHIQRDTMTLLLVLLSPVLVLILFAYSVVADINNVPITIMDLDNTITSRALIQQITQGEDLDLVSMAGSYEEIESLLLKGEIKAALILPPGFEHDLHALEGMPLQVLIDGTEPTSGGFALEKIGLRAENYAIEALADNLSAYGIEEADLQPISMEIRTWYNPALKANVDIIPGLISMVLGLPGMTVALTLAREREHGTFEQLLATPISRLELLLGKILPYIFSGWVNVVLVTVTAMLIFDVPLNGSFPLFLFLSSLYLFSILSLCMLIGVFIPTQAAAMALSFLVLFLPGLFLTGVFFPISSMPDMVRLEALSLPGSHYAVITRGIFTTGVGLDVLWVYALALFGMGAAFTAAGAFLFKKRIA